MRFRRLFSAPAGGTISDYAVVFPDDMGAMEVAGSTLAGEA